MLLPNHLWLMLLPCVAYVVVVLADVIANVMADVFNHMWQME